MSVKEVMTNLADAARARYSVSDKLTVADITDLIQGENADVAKLIDRSITKIEISEGVTEIGKEAFRGCSQLTEVTLPSTITSIGENAFADCDALAQVTCSFYETQVTGYPWGADVDATSFIFMARPPLTLTAQEAGSTVKLTKQGNATTVGLQYRTDANAKFSTYTIDTVITLTNIGDYVQFYNTVDSLSFADNHFVQFEMTGKIAASGNIQSMLNYSDSCSAWCYYSMFEGCKSLTQAPELPATTLAERCYNGMFYGCTSLTQAPELPATKLATICYAHMFYNCSSLTKAPELPATTLANSCYESMFISCTSLTTAPDLPATTLADYCYTHMFRYCTSLTQAPELPATTLANWCYADMFGSCTSLTQAPDLPATTLADTCYWWMFRGCSRLSYISVNFTKWVDGTTSSWLNDVASSGTFVAPAELPDERGSDRIPGGWTVVRKD